MKLRRGSWQTLAPSAVIAEVARHWQVCSQQVFTWRREMRHNTPFLFVPVVAEPGVAPREPTPSPCIEIQATRALVRVLPDTSCAKMLEPGPFTRPGGAPLWCPDLLRLSMRGSGHGERPLPDAQGQEHRPRAEEGLARCRSSRLVHGKRSAVTREAAKLRGESRRLNVQLRELMALIHDGSDADPDDVLDLFVVTSEQKLG